MAVTWSYPSDVSDNEWAFVALYLCLVSENAPQREHPLQALLNGLRYLAHTGEDPKCEAAVHGLDLQGITNSEGQNGIVLLPPPLGRRTQLCLVQPLPVPGAELRVVEQYLAATSFCRLRLYYARQTRQPCITGSSGWI